VVATPNARGKVGYYGPQLRTIEVDNLVNVDGVWVAVEIDGPWHTPERAVDDNRRHGMFMVHGVNVLRFDATQAYHEPDGIVAEIVMHAEATRRARRSAARSDPRYRIESPDPGKRKGCPEVHR
jgi:hypothetical protein